MQSTAVGRQEILEDNLSAKNTKEYSKSVVNTRCNGQGTRYNGQHVDVADRNGQRGNKLTYAQILMKTETEK